VLCDTHDTSILIVDTYVTILVDTSGSIEYRDTRDGIVIVVPISGIAQHYHRVLEYSTTTAANVTLKDIYSK